MMTENLKTVLVQGAGGGGGNNLIRSLRDSDLNLRILGSNCVSTALMKSTADKTFHLVDSQNENYISDLKKLVLEEQIDLIIPNNDREVGIVSRLRSEIPCKVFLPEDDVVQTCHDKHRLYLKLKQTNADIHMAPSVALDSMDDLDAAFSSLPVSEKYWVRPRRGSGSRGATWVYNVDQARKWIDLWVELRAYKTSDFQICNFLPGRDYCFQSVWKKGEMVVGKLCERLSYYGGENRLSNMSSTPAVARTLMDREALDTIFKAVYSLTSKPHGNFNMDLKGNCEGNMKITEINIGRFCMITTIFDKTGKINTAEAYVRSAFGESMDVDDPIDIEEGYLLIRELDTEPLVIHESSLL